MLFLTIKKKLFNKKIPSTPTSMAYWLSARLQPQADLVRIPSDTKSTLALYHLVLHCTLIVFINTTSRWVTGASAGTNR